MMNVKVIVFVLSLHHTFGHLSSPENDSLDTTGLFPSTTSGQVSGSLRNILNQESLVRFAMVQRIQKLVMDLVEVKNDFQDLQKKLVDIKDELHSLETKDQKLEKENAELKQTLKVIYTRRQTDELANIDFENLKNETLALKIKYDRLLLENKAFHNQLNLMNGKVKNMDDLNTRLHLLEGSMQNLFVSVNTSFENIREDLNASRIPQVTGSLEISSGSGVTPSSTTETTMITTPATTQVPTSKGTEPNLNPTTTPATTQVPTSKGSRGREFLILFMRNHPAAKGSLNIYVAADSGVMVNISTSPNLDATIKSAVDRRSNIAHYSKFVLPPELTCEYGTVESKAVVLQTSELSTVTIFDGFHSTSNDATLIIPTHKLSKKHFVSSTQPYTSYSDFYSQVAVGALNDDTNIKITFKMKTKSPISLLGDTYRDGEVLSLTLERLETFQVGHTTDLSGTVITSSKPVAVFSGNRCNRLKSGCSHMLTQLPPVSELDNQYIVPPFYKNAGTLIQVISGSQNTVNCSVGDRVSTWLLGDTEYKNVEVTSNEITVIISDRPVLVTGFGMGGSYHPYMTVIPGVQQYLNYYKVVVPAGYDENFLCVMISSESIKSLRINGNTKDHYEAVYQGYAFVEKTFQVSTFKVQNGSFELTTLDKSHFGLLVYGHRRDDGYGFAGNFVLI